MSDDLPYKAEYAKSGRAGCKGCKTNIAQDSLRIAKMVQSPHFDGKVPNWFHMSCFFKKFNPKSTGDIDKFDSLRWNDQETLRTKIGGSSGAGSSRAAAKKKSSGPKDFKIEYSKSSRAKCRSCEEKIEKDVVRVAKMEESDDAKFAGLIPRWYHVDCFVDSKVELEATDLTTEDIEGFSSISEEDQTDFISKSGIKKKAKNGKNKKEEKPAQSKEDNEKEKLLKKQNKAYWELRDNLFKHCPNNTLRELLEANNYGTTGGESTILDRCADGILFGALQECPECENGRLTYRSEGYICTGHISGWTKCMYVTQAPQRKVWKIPKDLKEEIPLLAKIKLKVTKRAFPKTVVKEEKKAVADAGPPLKDKKIIIVGKLKLSKSAIKDKIIELGGTLSEAVTKTVYCCLSSPGEVMKMCKKMQTVESHDIPVVTEDYLDAIKNGGATLMLTQYAIAPWGGKKQLLDEVDAPKKSGLKRKIKSEEETSKKAKLTLKGGAVVDPDSGLEDKCHILSMRGELQTCVLGQVDLTKGTNSYYKLQVLEHDTKKKWYVFRAWGRVGTNIGGNKLEHFLDANDAVWNFREVYEEKTGNKWGSRKNFVKQPYKFYPLDIDYGQDDEALKSAITPGSLSTLANPIKELIKMIFDIEAMKHQLVEFEIDLKKMPLGKLSKAQIETAYKCLGESQTCLVNNEPKSKLLDVSNRFYTLIPHDFGMKKPPLLDNEELIKLKIGMLDSLLEIEVAYSLLQSSTNDQAKDPIDAHYESLKTNINLMKKEDENFQLIEDYVKNTHAKTHSGYSLKVDQVFTIERAGEKQRYRPFKDLPNKMLLWHGSRTTNYAGILSQGLRIAPPEAPVTGYMFGKGIYFADMSSKSANYCRTTRKNNTGLMLLCEVALGNMYELKDAEHVVKLPPGKHSCKGIGTTCPDPSKVRTLKDGVRVPLGEGMDASINDTSLLYNEYIVYDVAQVNMKYLVQLKFDYKF